MRYAYCPSRMQSLHALSAAAAPVLPDHVSVRPMASVDPKLHLLEQGKTDVSWEKTVTEFEVNQEQTKKTLGRISLALAEQRRRLDELDDKIQRLDIALSELEARSPTA